MDHLQLLLPSPAASNAVCTLARREGIFRRHMVLADGHIRDSVYFSIIDADWPQVKAGLEKRLRY